MEELLDTKSVAKKIAELNPGVEIFIMDPNSGMDQKIIYISGPTNGLVLPEGYIHIDNNEITNKGRTQSGFYSYFKFDDPKTITFADQLVSVSKTRDR